MLQVPQVTLAMRHILRAGGRSWRLEVDRARKRLKVVEQDFSGCGSWVENAEALEMDV